MSAFAETGLTPLPPGKIACIVTSLEMRAPPVPIPDAPVRQDVVLRRVERPDAAWYRDLFQRVGAPWLWTSRLKLDGAALSRVLDDPQVEVFALSHRGRDDGLLELDFRVASECELAFVGVVPALIGTGAGRMMLRFAIARAWQRPIARLWVHTCTLDSPAALALYQRAGFRAYAQAVEIDDDPRLSGLLPPDVAGHVPIIAPC